MEPNPNSLSTADIPHVRQTAGLIQKRLLENFMTLARSSISEETFTTSLQNTLDVSVELSGAHKGSLFLLDDTGAVVDSILTSGETDRERRSELIGSVLDKGLAGWVYRNRTTGLIEDTLKDDRWLTLPDQPYSVRSALAVPIMRRNDLIGILTLIHPEPGALTLETEQLMQAVSDQLALVLENTRLYARLSRSYLSLAEAKEKIEAYSAALHREMESGRQIQKEFLPILPDQLDGWQLSACFMPARQVSGDFYDVFFLGRTTLALVIGDVCDKGVGAALYMALFRSLLRIFAGQRDLFGDPVSSAPTAAAKAVNLCLQGGISRDLDPDPVVNRALNAVFLTNDYIAHNHGRKGMFATLFLGILDLDSGKLIYINAGHEAPLIVDGSGIRQTLAQTGPAVGLFVNADFRIKTDRIEPGSALIGMTDGVTEARSPDDALYTKERLIALLDRPGIPAQTLLERLKQDLIEFIGGAAQSDDITLTALVRKPSRRGRDCLKPEQDQ